MIKACRDADRKLMIAYRLQYDANHRALIDMARKKTFGELRFIEAVNGQNDARNGQWRQIKALAGGGSLPDVGIYCLNAFRYITGEEPIEVAGRITQPKGDPRFREIEDIATFTLAFPSGVLASGSCATAFTRAGSCAAWQPTPGSASIRRFPTTGSSRMSAGRPATPPRARISRGRRKTSSPSSWTPSPRRSPRDASRTHPARKGCRT